MLRLDKEIHKIIGSMLQNDNIIIYKIIKYNKKRIILVINEPTRGGHKIFIKIYYRFKKEMIINEYNNIAIFYAQTKGKVITAPKPLAFDSENGAIAYEFVEGSSFREILLRFNNYKCDFEACLKLAAESLSEYHRIFEVKENCQIDLGKNPSIEKYFRDCALKSMVRPFLDFAPHNIMFSSNIPSKKVFLIDFPQYNFNDKNFSSLPHADLAYFLWHMMRIGRYPQFSILKKDGWNDKKIIKLILYSYFERLPVELAQGDIYIINYFFNAFAQNWSRAPWGFKSEPKDRVRGLFLKYYSNILLDSVLKSFEL